MFINFEIKKFNIYLVLERKTGLANFSGYVENKILIHDGFDGLVFEMWVCSKCAERQKFPLDVQSNHYLYMREPNQSFCWDSTRECFHIENWEFIKTNIDSWIMDELIAVTVTVTVAAAAAAITTITDRMK